MALIILAITEDPSVDAASHASSLGAGVATDAETIEAEINDDEEI